MTGLQDVAVTREVVGQGGCQLGIAGHSAHSLKLKLVAMTIPVLMELAEQVEE